MNTLYTLYFTWILNIDNIYKKLKNTTQIKITLKILIVFDDVTADMLSNKKSNSIVTALFIDYRKINVSFIFISFCFAKK